MLVIYRELTICCCTPILQFPLSLSSMFLFAIAIIVLRRVCSLLVKRGASSHFPLLYAAMILMMIAPLSELATLELQERLDLQATQMSLSMLRSK